MYHYQTRTAESAGFLWRDPEDIRVECRRLDADIREAELRLRVLSEAKEEIASEMHEREDNREAELLFEILLDATEDAEKKFAALAAECGRLEEELSDSLWLCGEGKEELS